MTKTTKIKNILNNIDPSKFLCQKCEKWKTIDNFLITKDWISHKITSRSSLCHKCTKLKLKANWNIVQKPDLKTLYHVDIKQDLVNMINDSKDD